MVRTTLAALLLAAACNPPDPDPPATDAAPDAPEVARVDVLTYPAVANPDLDLLFVIDDSPSMLDKQMSLKNAFPTLIAQLSAINGGVPNLHLGVISSDMGTKGSAVMAPGPSVGQLNQGGCAQSGKGGALIKGAAPITDGKSFVTLDRGGAKNFTGTLAEAFSAMASLGAGGCGFEQPLHALKTSLASTVNPGFFRASANLAVVILTDEDDCSLLTPAMLGPESPELGPQQSFRCFRFGVECSPDDVNVVGAKSQCRPRKTSQYVEDIAPFRDALLAMKGGDPRKVSLGVIAGTSAPVQVEARTPPGGGVAMNALAHSCQYSVIAGGTAVADPPVRLGALTTAFGLRGTLTSVCSEDLTPAAIDIGVGIQRLVGDTCLPAALPSAPDCVVTETRDGDAAAGRRIPACAGGNTDLCYEIVADQACRLAPHQRLQITRSTAAAADAWITLSCAPAT